MNVAFIPVRGGSKSIPLKNIKRIAGEPLVYWTVKAACECGWIDRVYVATDSSEIRETVEKMKSGGSAAFEKTTVIGRSAESATDTASTESAMLEFAAAREFENIVLVQATSPLLTADDLDRGFAAFNEAGTDSVLSVVRQKRFVWRADEEGYARPVNYDVFHRPRRQEFDGFLVENGAFYITSRTALLSARNRISGNIRTVEMDPDSYNEIDEPEDWIVIEELLRRKLAREDALKGKAKDIRLFLTDCDGCLTDGGMYYSEKGDELKKFNTRDGMGLQLLRERGILTGILTGESVALNRRRAAKLKLDVFVDGCRDKAEAIRSICAERGISLYQVAYVGDDINDVEALKLVGIGFCPADAHPAAREAADIVVRACGGKGVIREAADFVLSKQY